MISRERKSKMKNLLLLLITLFFYGCASTLPLPDTTLLHEQFENGLVSKQEFMERVEQSATLIYEGMSAINEAAKQYALDHNDKLPTGNVKVTRSLLLEGGYLEAWPVIPPFAFTEPVQTDFKYWAGAADMDGIGKPDDWISASDLKVEVCENFIRRYSSFGPGDIIHNYEANGEKYPGKVVGRHIKIYAITWSWSESLDYCDIEWVVQYN
jgi:hypothetical protein